MPLDRTNGSDGSDAAGGSGRAAAAARKAGNPLQRGSACLACRKRKMVCDYVHARCHFLRRHSLRTYTLPFSPMRHQS